jgi:hypothetical protein
MEVTKRVYVLMILFETAVTARAAAYRGIFAPFWDTPKDFRREMKTMDVHVYCHSVIDFSKSAGAGIDARPDRNKWRKTYVSTAFYRRPFLRPDLQRTGMVNPSPTEPEKPARAARPVPAWLI